MKLEALTPYVAAQEAPVAEQRPAFGLRIIFLLASLAVVLAAHAPITALAAHVIS